MAARFFVNGGVDNNWSTIGNWSTTSGGAGGSAIPTSSDAVTLDTNSPNCIMDGTTALFAASLDFTSYTNILTLNNIIISLGNITLGIGMKPIQGSGGFSFSSAGTKNFTTNGISIPSFICNQVSPVIALQDDLYVSKVFSFAGSNQISGGKTIRIKGAISFAGSSTATTIVATVLLLNPTKMMGNGTIAALNAIPSFPGYNQEHTI